MAVCLVLGASGQIGRFLVPALLETGHDVFALSRSAREARHARLHWLRGDLIAAPPLLPALDAVFSLGPLDRLAPWIAVARPAGRPRVIAFGSMSALSKRDSIDAAERALAARLVDAEDALARTCEAQSLAWTVLRTTLIYGAGLDRSLTPIAGFGRRWRVLPSLPGARGLRQPVHAQDLAAACLALWRQDVGARTRYALGGGERLAFADLLARVRSSLGVSCLGVPLPVAVLATAWPLLHQLSAGRLPGAAAVARLGVDLVADDAPARRDFGWDPRGFAPTPSTWSTTDLAY